MDFNDDPDGPLYSKTDKILIGCFIMVYVVFFIGMILYLNAIQP